MASKPVTVLITRRVRRGAEAEFERAMRGMFDAAQGFAGHLGGHLIRPDTADGDDNRYQVLFAFDDDAHLQAWTVSAERRHWLGQVEPLIEGSSSTRRLGG